MFHPDACTFCGASPDKPHLSWCAWIKHVNEVLSCPYNGPVCDKPICVTHWHGMRKPRVKSGWYQDA